MKRAENISEWSHELPVTPGLIRCSFQVQYQQAKIIQQANWEKFAIWTLGKEPAAEPLASSENNWTLNSGQQNIHQLSILSATPGSWQELTWPEQHYYLALVIITEECAYLKSRSQLINFAWGENPRHQLRLTALARYMHRYQLLRGRAIGGASLRQQLCGQRP